jgi:hypothetical protein
MEGSFQLRPDWNYGSEFDQPKRCAELIDLVKLMDVCAKDAEHLTKQKNGNPTVFNKTNYKIWLIFNLLEVLHDHAIDDLEQVITIAQLIHNWSTKDDVQGSSWGEMELKQIVKKLPERYGKEALKNNFGMKTYSRPITDEDVLRRSTITGRIFTDRESEWDMGDAYDALMRRAGITPPPWIN